MKDAPHTMHAEISYEIARTQHLLDVREAEQDGARSRRAAARVVRRLFPAVRPATPGRG